MVHSWCAEVIGLTLAENGGLCELAGMSVRRLGNVNDIGSELGRTGSRVWVGHWNH
jgi:hypothetical protein